MLKSKLKRLNEAYYVKRSLVGDVVVSLGTSWIARFIARITKGAMGHWSCNHVAIVGRTEEGESICTVEALKDGVTVTPFEWHWKHCKRWLVIRHKDRLTGNMMDMDFLPEIRKFIGYPYAFHQLLQNFRAILLQVGLGKQWAYRRLVDTADPNGLTCTEFVGLVYESLDVRITPMFPARYLTANDFLESLQFDTVYTSEDTR